MTIISIVKFVNMFTYSNDFLGPVPSCFFRRSWDFVSTSVANLKLPTTKAGHEDAESERRLRPRRQAAPLAGLHEAAREDLGIQKLAFFFQIGERALEGSKINVVERPGVGTDILQHSLADSWRCRNFVKTSRHQISLDDTTDV